VRAQNENTIEISQSSQHNRQSKSKSIIKAMPDDSLA